MACHRYIFRFFSAWLAGLLLFVALAGFFPSSKCRCRSLDKGGGDSALVGGLEFGSAAQVATRFRYSTGDANAYTGISKDVFAASLPRVDFGAQGLDEFSWIRVVLGDIKPAQASSVGDFHRAQRNDRKAGNSRKSSSKENKKRASDGACPFSQLRGLSTGLFIRDSSVVAQLPQIASLPKNSLCFRALNSFHQPAKHQARAPPYSSI